MHTKSYRYLHLKASLELYTCGQGTVALPQVFALSCIIGPPESNSVHFCPTIYFDNTCNYDLYEDDL